MAFDPVGGRFGLANIALGQSSGGALGRIGDALLGLIKHLPKDAELSHEDRAAIHALKDTLAEIEEAKTLHAKDR